MLSSTHLTLTSILTDSTPVPSFTSIHKSIPNLNSNPTPTPNPNPNPNLIVNPIIIPISLPILCPPLYPYPTPSLRSSLEMFGQFLQLGGFPPHILPFLFLWPMGSLLTYLDSKDTADNPRCVACLNTMLRGLGALGVRRVSLLGHSMGARVLVNFFSSRDNCYLNPSPDPDLSRGEEEELPALILGLGPPEPVKGQQQEGTLRKGQGQEKGQGLELRLGEGDLETGLLVGQSSPSPPCPIFDPLPPVAPVPPRPPSTEGLPQPSSIIFMNPEADLHRFHQAYSTSMAALVQQGITVYCDEKDVAIASSETINQLQAWARGLTKSKGGSLDEDGGRGGGTGAHGDAVIPNPSPSALKSLGRVCGSLRHPNTGRPLAKVDVVDISAMQVSKSKSKSKSK